MTERAQLKYSGKTADIANELARVRRLLRGGDPLRAVDAFLSALAGFDGKSAPPGARIVTEHCIRECVEDLGRNRAVRSLLVRLDTDASAEIPYRPGCEDRLCNALRVLRKGLCSAAQVADAPKSSERQNKDRRRIRLWNDAARALTGGKTARGKAALRRMALEFGREPGVLANIGNLLLNANEPEEAAGHLRLAARRFPHDAGAHASLLLAYARHGRDEMAQDAHERIMEAFGNNLNVLLELAPAYLDWGNRDKAMELARSLESMPPAYRDYHEYADLPVLERLKSFTASADN